MSNYPAGVTQDSFDREMEGLGYDPAEEEQPVVKMCPTSGDKYTTVSATCPDCGDILEPIDSDVEF